MTGSSGSGQTHTSIVASCGRARSGAVTIARAGSDSNDRRRLGIASTRPPSANSAPRHRPPRPRSPGTKGNGTRRSVPHRSSRYRASPVGKTSARATGDGHISAPHRIRGYSCPRLARQVVRWAYPRRIGLHGRSLIRQPSNIDYLVKEPHAQSTSRLPVARLRSSQRRRFYRGRYGPIRSL